jgi:hypothetical protein
VYLWGIHGGRSGATLLGDADKIWTEKQLEALTLLVPRELEEEATKLAASSRCAVVMKPVDATGVGDAVRSAAARFERSSCGHDSLADEMGLT